jgi:hypothetical protein
MKLVVIWIIIIICLRLEILGFGGDFGCGYIDFMCFIL